MKGAVTVLLVLVVAHLAAEQGRADLCEDLRGHFQACFLFLIGVNPEPTPECCDGARAFQSQVKSAEDKQATCKCIKTKEIVDNANKLFSTCRAPLPFPISDDMDCDKIQ